MKRFNTTIKAAIMRYLILAICTTIFLTNSVVFAQTKSKRLNIELQYGPSFPVGKFGSKDYKDTSAGLAQAGSAVNLSFSYQFTNRIAAVLFVLGGSVNQQDEEAMENRWNDPGSNVQTKVITGRWGLTKLMLGGKYRLPITTSGKFFFTSKLLGGVFKSGAPAYSGVTYYNDVPVGNFSSSNIPLPWAFCYHISTGLELGLTKNFGLVTDLSFFNGKAVWRYEHWTYNPNSTPTSTPIETKYSFAAISILVGVKVNL
jgi:hypothetical protein